MGQIERQDEPEHDERCHEPEKQSVVVDRDPEHYRPSDAEDPRGASGEIPFPRRDHDDEAQAQSCECEIVAAQSHERQADEQRDEHRGENAGSGRDRPGDIEFGQQNGVRVGTDSEECGLTQTHLPGQTHEQAQPDGGQGEDHREHGDVHHRGARRERDDDRHDDEDGAPDQGAAVGRPESLSGGEVADEGRGCGVCHCVTP